MSHRKLRHLRASRCATALSCLPTYLTSKTRMRRLCVRRIHCSRFPCSCSVSWWVWDSARAYVRTRYGKHYYKHAITKLGLECHVSKHIVVFVSCFDSARFPTAYSLALSCAQPAAGCVYPGPRAVACRQWPSDCNAQDQPCGVTRPAQRGGLLSAACCPPRLTLCAWVCACCRRSQPSTLKSKVRIVSLIQGEDVCR